MRYSYSYATLFYYFWLWSLYNQPTGIEKKVIGESTPATLLKDLPKKNLLWSDYINSEIKRGSIKPLKMEAILVPL
jgi:hypothetical protein